MTANVTGICTKNITIPINNTNGTYNLSSNINLGLPTTASIIGFWTRVPDPFLPIRTNDNQTLFGVQNEFALLQLKDRAGEDLINRVPLRMFNPGVFPAYTIFLEPIQNNCVDWLASNITIPNFGTVIPPSGQSLELIVLWTENKQFTPPHIQKFYTNTAQAGVRVQQLHINTIANIGTYPLSQRSTVALPTEAILLGYRTNNEIGTRTPTGRANINVAARECAFLTLKDATSNIIIDQTPFSVFPNQFLFPYPYIPIAGRKVCEIDWQSSTVEFTNPSVVTGNEAIQILLYYTIP